jgi:hypothetical protein
MLVAPYLSSKLIHASAMLIAPPFRETSDASPVLKGRGFSPAVKHLQELGL